MLTFMGRCRELLLYQRIFSPGKGKIFVVVLAYKKLKVSPIVIVDGFYL